MSRVSAWILLSLALLCGAESASAQARAPGQEREERLRALGLEIDKLREELATLGRQERGVLSALDRLAAERRLREAELREATLRARHAQGEVDALAERLEALASARMETRAYLEFRLRELYKRGAGIEVRKLIGDSEVARFVDGLRYGAWLSERDARTLQRYREQTRELERERARLVQERDRRDAIRKEASAARQRVERSRRERARMLESIQQDRAVRAEALNELEEAAGQLGRIIEDAGSASPGPELDVRKFRGLLESPVAGRVSAGFGTLVHPRFRTEVPHPGLDIEAPSGTPFHAVFEGTVVFASWLRGYGLTAILDHGSGLVSVYAHASVLVVSRGERVSRGQELGRVGDTGSLRGAYLYFELREDGEPVDPALWLRR